MNPITGVHFVYRPVAPSRDEALAEAALIATRDTKDRLTIYSIEYDDGEIVALDTDPYHYGPNSTPSESFAVQLQWHEDERLWGVQLQNSNGFANSEHASLNVALGELLHNLHLQGGGDWLAVNRNDGTIA